MKISTIIPSYNEETFIEECLKKSLEAHKDLGHEFEIIAVDDGCTDRTPEITERLSREKDEIKHLSFENRLGKGKAIETGFKEAEGDYLIFYDTDLSTDLEYLEKLLENLDNGFDAVIGSRLHEETDLDSRFHRAMVRKSYSCFLNLLFDTDIGDLQCGFKGFRKEAYINVVDDMKAEHMFWDTEIIIRMCHQGHKVKEIPVEWTKKPESKTRTRDVFPKFPVEALKLKKELRGQDCTKIKK